MPVPIVFLSHSSRDAEIAKALKEVLARHTKGEIEWWLSSDGQSIRGGKNWRSEVEQALRNCQLVLILFTPVASQSAWVHYEAGFADALGREIIPVALPGFDIDQIPGPLQHKQGFNLRGSAGLNNILSITNQILGRHDLLSLDEAAYKEAFAALVNADELPQQLDLYIDTVTCDLVATESVIRAIADKALQTLRHELVEENREKDTVLAGPGFVLREEGPPPSDAAGVTDTTHRLHGDMVVPALLELLPMLSQPELAALLRGGGEIECNLRPGATVLTNQAQVLACMRGTQMRWAGENRCSFRDVSFFARAFDANDSGVMYSVTRHLFDRTPEPYRPKDMRYVFSMRWQADFPGATIRELLALLVERNVIFSKTGMS